MFSAYLDASGNSDEKAVTVAGFVSTVAKWEAFAPAWKSILAEWGVPKFRMTEFANRSGDYKDFPKDSAKRRLFIEQLVACVRKHTNKAFSVTVITSAWNLRNEEYHLHENRGNQYCIGSIGCIELAFQWALKGNPKRVPIEFFFEDGDPGKGELMDHAKRMHGVTPLFRDKAFTPFQPADLIAWKRRVALSQREAITKMGDREMALDLYESSMRSLEPISKIPGKFMVHDARTLLEHCKYNDIPKRIAREPK
jgi:hypothetical protein